MFSRHDVIVVTTCLVLEQVSFEGAKPEYKNLHKSLPAIARFDEVADFLLQGTLTMASNVWGGEHWFAGGVQPYKEGTRELHQTAAMAIGSPVVTHLFTCEHKKYWKSSFTWNKTMFWLLKYMHSDPILAGAPADQIRDHFGNISDVMKNKKFEEMVAARDPSKVLCACIYYLKKICPIPAHYSITVSFMAEWVAGNITPKVSPKMPAPRVPAPPTDRWDWGRPGYGKYANTEGHRVLGTDPYRTKTTWTGNVDTRGGWSEKWRHTEKKGDKSTSHYLESVRDFEKNNSCSLRNVPRNKDRCCMFHCLNVLDSKLPKCERDCADSSHPRHHDNQENKKFIEEVRKVMGTGQAPAGPAAQG